MEKWSFQRTRELMTPRALRGMAVNEVGRARISMMVRSMSSNSRPDTLVQDRTPQPHRFLLQRTAGPYIGSGTTDLRCPRNVGSSPNFRRIAVSQQTTVRWRARFHRGRRAGAACRQSRAIHTARPGEPTPRLGRAGRRSQPLTRKGRLKEPRERFDLRAGKSA